MKSNFNKIEKKIKKNIELFFLLTLILISILVVQIYNNNKVKINQNYTNLIYNIYFQKSLNHIFNNLKPKYLNIEHKIIPGETFDQILKSYDVSKYEIKIVKKNIADNKNINNLKTNQILKFTIEQSSNRKVTSFTLPLSRTKKIQLTRIIGSNKFIKKT